MTIFTGKKKGDSGERNQLLLNIQANLFIRFLEVVPLCLLN